MNFKKISIGSIFIIFSGIIFEFDKFLNYFRWKTYLVAISGTGVYHDPDRISIFDNYFVILFLLIGVIFYIDAFINFKNWRKNNK